MPENIGVLGGTFDPIHNGHLHVALKTLEAFWFSRVYFLIAQTPPHKSAERLTSAFHRFAMVSLALSNYPGYLASTIELEPGASPFTIDTLGELSRQLKVAPYSLFFLAGSDSFWCIHTWKNYEELLTKFNVVFIDRPDARIGEGPWPLPARIQARIVDLRPQGTSPIPPAEIREGLQKESRVFLLAIDAPEISSTAVRRSLPLEGATRRLVPQPVADYINKYCLYEP